MRTVFDASLTNKMIKFFNETISDIISLINLYEAR